MLRSKSPTRFRLIALVVSLAAVSAGSAATICFVPHDSSGPGPNWDFGFGVALITTSKIENAIFGDFRVTDGAGGGEVYALTASKRLGHFEWKVGGKTFRPRLEMPLTLEIVDEDNGRTFLDYNASVMLRWVDFPWNETVSTTFGLGMGLSYSSKVYEMDRVAHPGDDRSHLKFNLPVEWTFASPSNPDQQLMLFILHQSGGHVFDTGGVNSVGIGFRTSF